MLFVEKVSSLSTSYLVEFKTHMPQHSKLHRYQYIADAANTMDRLMREGSSEKESYKQILMIASETLMSIENDSVFFQAINAKNASGLPSNAASKTRSYFRYFLDIERLMLIREASLNSKLANKMIVSIEKTIKYPSAIIDSADLHDEVRLLRIYVQSQLSLLEKEDFRSRKKIRKLIRKVIYGIGGLTMVAANTSIPPFPILGQGAETLSISISGAFFGALIPPE